MGKIYQKRMKQSDQDHDHVGWMSGFISLFEFRRGGSNHRIPSDKRIGNKAHGEGYTQDMTGSVDSDYKFDYNPNDSSQSMVGAGKQSVKNLIEEEMVVKNDTKLNRNDSFMEFVDFAKDADTNNLVREIFIRIQQNHSGGVEQGQDNFCVLPEKIHARFVEQFTDATKVLLQEKLIGRVHIGLDGKSQYSREFIDALETLISHKDLFFKLLEDPNSELTRRINNLINSELGKYADEKESEGLHYHKPSLFSRLKVRSQEVRLLNSDASSEVPPRSAMLEPGSETSSSSYSINSYELRLKSKSSFSFTEIKRRLKRVMGKDKEEDFTKNEMARGMSRRYLVSRAGGDSFGRMSPSRNPHLEAEIHPRRLSNSGWCDFESIEKVDKALENEIVEPSVKKISSSLHNFHLLTDDIFYGKLSNKGDLALTGRSFSMTDYIRSPSLRPARQSSMPTASLRKSLSSRDNSHVLEQENNVNADVDLSDRSAVVASCKSDNDSCANFGSQDPGPILSENIVIGDDKGEETFSAAITNAVRDKQVAVDDGYAAPSEIISEDSNLGSDKTENFDEVTSGTDKRPSPTSVLEPTYPEDEISPTRTNIQGELPVSPLRIHFERDDDSSGFNSNKSPFVKKSFDDNEPKLRKYIKELLIASDFSWDTSYVRYLSSDQLLDASLYDAEMDTDSDEPFNDYMLLLDLLNEVLVDACARYFGCSPWASLSKLNIRPILDTENNFQEIVEQVESHLLPSPYPQSLEQILAKEIFKEESWTDFQFDVETIGTEIADLILQKLIIDTALSCFSFTERPRLILV